MSSSLTAFPRPTPARSRGPAWRNAVLPIEEEDDCMQSIKHEVRQYVVDNFIMGASSQELQDDDSFMAGHFIDSTGILELISFLEQTFGIKVEDEEMGPASLDRLNCLEQYMRRTRGDIAGRVL